MHCQVVKPTDRRSGRAGLSLTRRERALRVLLVCAELPQPGEPATLSSLARQMASLRNISLELESEATQVLSVYEQAVDVWQGGRSRRSPRLAVPHEGDLAGQSSNANPRQSPVRGTSMGVPIATTDPYYRAVKPFGGADYASGPLGSETLFSAAKRDCSPSPRKRRGPQS